jgi:hypothetical protein
MCSIESIEVPVENNNLKSIDGVLYTKDGKVLLFYPPAKPDKVFFIPSGVEIVGYNNYYYSFEKCTYLEELYIPASVKEFTGTLWYSDNLRKVVYAGDSQITILKSALFQYCTSLESICLPKSLQTFSSSYYGKTFRYYS